MLALIQELEERNVKSRLRKLASGKEVGGIPFTTGPLDHLLGNRVYLGEINHRDKSYPGEHQPIITLELFDNVQQLSRAGAGSKPESYEKSGALLAGLIFNDKGNRMSPVHVKKGNVRYRYYQSWVLAQGQKAKAGTVNRVPATEIERVVSNAVMAGLGITHADPAEESSPVREHVGSITVLRAQIKVKLKGPIADKTEDAEVNVAGSTLTIPWSKPSTVRKREILGATTDHPKRPIRPVCMFLGIRVDGDEFRISHRRTNSERVHSPSNLLACCLTH